MLQDLSLMTTNTERNMLTCHHRGLYSQQTLCSCNKNNITVTDSRASGQEFVQKRSL